MSINFIPRVCEGVCELLPVQKKPLEYVMQGTLEEKPRFIEESDGEE